MRETQQFLLLAGGLGYISEDQYRAMKQRVDAVFSPLYGLQKAVTKEAGIPAAFIALIASTPAITLGKCLTSLA